MSQPEPPVYPVRRSARTAFGAAADGDASTARQANPKLDMGELNPTHVAPAFPVNPARPVSGAEQLDPTRVAPVIPPAPANRRRAAGSPLAVGRGGSPGRAYRDDDEIDLIPPPNPVMAQPPGRDAYPPGPPQPRRRRRAPLVIVVLLILVLAWPIGLIIWANSKLVHVEALSGAANTPGTTWLIAGSDERGSGGINNADVSGARADSIMILHQPESGKTALMSLPRDTYVDIPGHGQNKINSSLTLGGPRLLVRTVEGLTGLTIDHYVELGFGSVTELVDAVGGVELCLDKTVKEKHSKLNWKKGCHQADGDTALAFSRMRYKDPLGDIGRAQRQRQVVAATMKKALSPARLINPATQIKLLSAGTSAVAVDERANVVDLAKLALGFRAATGPDGATGAPTIADMGYDPGGGVGSTVLLDEEASTAEFQQLAEGTWDGSDLTKAN